MRRSPIPVSSNSCSAVHRTAHSAEQLLTRTPVDETAPACRLRTVATAPADPATSVGAGTTAEASRVAAEPEALWG